MTSTTTNAKASRNGHMPQASVIRAGAPLPVREKRPAYVALAVLLIVGLAAVGAYLYTQAGKKTPVVEVVNHIAAGHTISRADLTTVDVAGGVTAVGGANLQSLVGQTAAVELLPRTLVQRSMVTDAPTLTSSQAQVARLVGETVTDATVYGTRGLWRLRLSMDFENRHEHWKALRSVATVW